MKCTYVVVEVSICTVQSIHEAGNNWCILVLVLVFSYVLEPNLCRLKSCTSGDSQRLDNGYPEKVLTLGATLPIISQLHL